MSWTALIPLNAPAQRKTRLSSRLDARGRVELSETMHRHVRGCALRCGLFARVQTVSPAPTHAGRWVQLEANLNDELTRARTLLGTPLLVLNADLPLLSERDLHALVRAAERHGCALAADRHGLGTNAVALMPDAALRFAFGPDSLRAHLRSAKYARVLMRRGLAWDLDTPADLALLRGREEYAHAE